MLLITILAMLMFIFVVSALIALAFGGSIFVLVFGDVILCGLLMIWIIKRFTKKGKH